MGLFGQLAPWLQQTLQHLTEPFLAFVTPRSRIFWVYLLTSLVPVLIFCALRVRGNGRSTIAAWWNTCFPKALVWSESARVDYAYYVINTVFMTTVFGVFTISEYEVRTAALAAFADWGVAPTTVFELPHAASVLIVTVLCGLAVDFGLFLAHYAQHKIPLLWEFHKVHHSAAVLTPITVYRMHPVDDVVVGLSAGVIGGLVQASLQHLVFAGVHDAKILGLNPIFFLSYVCAYHLRHSHFWLGYPAWLSHILISPAQHQIHHSKDQRHYDKNMGFIFAVWDHWFGTLYVPRGRERLEFGLSAHEEREFSSVARLYFLPFRKALGPVQRPRPSAGPELSRL